MKQTNDSKVAYKLEEQDQRNNMTTQGQDSDQGNVPKHRENSYQL